MRHKAFIRHRGFTNRMAGSPSHIQDQGVNSFFFFPVWCRLSLPHRAYRRPSVDSFLDGVTSYRAVDDDVLAAWWRHCGHVTLRAATWLALRNRFRVSELGSFLSVPCASVRGVRAAFELSDLRVHIYRQHNHRRQWRHRSLRWPFNSQ